MAALTARDQRAVLDLPSARVFCGRLPAFERLAVKKGDVTRIQFQRLRERESRRLRAPGELERMHFMAATLNANGQAAKPFLEDAPIAQRLHPDALYLRWQMSKREALIKEQGYAD